MVEKVAVVTLVTGSEWRTLAEATLPSLRAYAARLRADFIVIDKAIHPHPHYDKWQIYDILGRYDRVIYLDADMIVRPDCPDLFVLVAPELVGGENELASFPGQAQHLQRFCQLMGMPALPCPFYINGGMFVASSRHRQLFRPPEKVLTGIPWPEQNHLNARLIGERFSVVLLAPCFNNRHRTGDYLRNSFILHYSVLPREQRIELIRRDQLAWDRMFRRETTDETELCRLFQKYYADKCPKFGHSYSPIYYEYLKQYKEAFSHVLEIGIGYNELMKPLCGENYQVGASQRAWRDFFVNAKIYGLDIREDLLFSEERIACFFTDQSKKTELINAINKIRTHAADENLLFDLILDDGSHIVEHMMLSFQSLAQYVKVGGLYIIEDIKTMEVDLFENIKSDQFIIIKTHRGAMSVWDNFVIYKRIR